MYWLRAVPFIGVVAFVYVVFGRDEARSGLALALLTALLVGFVLNEIRKGLKEGIRATSYVVLTSAWIFLLNHGFANYVYYMDPIMQFDMGVANPGFQHLARFETMACVAAVGIWSGFRSPFAYRLGMTLDTNERLMKHLRWDFDAINWGVVMALVGVSYVARLVAFSMGVYGYSGDLEKMLAIAAYRQYITYTGQLGMVALLAVAIHHFGSSNPSRRWKGLIWVILAGETIWGLLAGFKSMVIMPIVVVVLVATMMRGKVPRVLVVVAVGLLLIAYAVIEPYRHARFADTSIVTQDIGDVASSMYGVAQGGEEYARANDVGTFYKVMGRTVMTEMGARAVQYKDEVGLKPEDPPFLQNLVLGTAYAFIPRPLWKGKPKANTGAWFTSVLTGQEFVYSATDMTPIAYMYFGGGIVAIFLGFFVIGLVQRTYEVALSRAGPGTAILTIGLMSSLVVMTSEVWGVIGVALQLTIGLFILQGRLFYR